MEEPLETAILIACSAISPEPGVPVHSLFSSCSSVA